MTSKYDYVAMKHEYVTSPTRISIRAISAKYGITSWSTVAEQARRNKWNEAREQYQALEATKTMEYLAEKRARKLTDMENDILEVIHASVVKLGIDLQDRWVGDPESDGRVLIPGQTMTPEGIVKLIDKYLVMSGQVTNREATLGLNLTADAGSLPLDLARELAAVSRSKGAGAGPVGRSPLPSLSAPKQVN